MKFIVLYVYLHSLNLHAIHNKPAPIFDWKYYRVDQIDEIIGDRQYILRLSGLNKEPLGYTDMCQISLKGQVVTVEEACSHLIDRINGLK